MNPDSQAPENQKKTMDRKAFIRQYKEHPPPAGVFRIRNTVHGRSAVGAGANLPGMLNRQCFQLMHGTHPDRELQSDWDTLGSDSFVFETLDQLEPQAKPGDDPSEDLLVLEQMWLAKLEAAGEALYDRTKKRIRRE